MISLRSTITQEVLSFFFAHEEASLYVNELARRLGLDSGNLTRKLIELEKEGLLRSELKGHQKYYSLNPTFPLLNEYKQIVLKTVGLERKLSEALKELPGIKRAFLFGSYAENKMDTFSDIDLMVIGDHSSLELQKRMSELQKKMNRDINVINLTEQEFKNRKKSDPLIKSVLSKPKISLA